MALVVLVDNQARKCPGHGPAAAADAQIWSAASRDCMALPTTVADVTKT
jgi:hypothetical protein